MKKIAVVGANSYIARNLLAVLQRKYPDCAAKLYGRAPAQRDGAGDYEQIDILDRNSVTRIDLDCDAVFMFVGKTGSAGGFDDYDTFLDVNERALLNLLSEYRRQKSSAKIIFPSTRLVYRGAEGPVTESAPKEFKTIYAINKYACEQYLEQYNRIFDIKYCIFRICVPYGTLVPGVSSYGTIGFMLEKAYRHEPITLYGDGSVKRTFTHIEDLCTSLIHGAFSDRCVNDVFNVGGEEMSLQEAAELIAEKYGVKIAHVPYPDIAGKIESGSTVFDAEKLTRTGIYTSHKFKDWINDGSEIMNRTCTNLETRVNRGGYR